LSRNNQNKKNQNKKNNQKKENKKEVEQKKEVEKPKEEECKKQEKSKKEDEDDDDLDLFGDDEEESTTNKTDKITEDVVVEGKEMSRAERMKLIQKAKDTKSIERSQIILEVKPWEIETDLVELWREITKIEKEGLTWGEGYKLQDVAYGIKKLILSCVVIDELVGVDDITEPIEAMEDKVQSVDMTSMSKL